MGYRRHLHVLISIASSPAIVPTKSSRWKPEVADWERFTSGETNFSLAVSTQTSRVKCLHRASWAHRSPRGRKSSQAELGSQVSNTREPVVLEQLKRDSLVVTPVQSSVTLEKVWEQVHNAILTRFLFKWHPGAAAGTFWSSLGSPKDEFWSSASLFRGVLLGSSVIYLLFFASGKHIQKNINGFY